MNFLRVVHELANAATITVTVRDKFWAAGIDSCDIAALW
jgi:hypothetical protein